MSKLTIVTCAGLFSLVASVSSIPECCEKEYKIGLSYHNEKMSDMEENVLDFISSSQNHIVVTQTMFQSIADVLYKDGNSRGDISMCLKLSDNLLTRINSDKVAATDCVFQKRDNIFMVMIKESRIKFEKKIKAITDSAQSENALQSSNNSNADNSKTTDRIRELLIQTRTGLDSITESFESVIGTSCKPFLTEELITGLVFRQLAEIKLCIDRAAKSKLAC